MNIPSDRRYTKEHEWILVDGEEGIVGISDFAQDQLGDVVFVELPEVGTTVRQHDSFSVVESVKVASDVYSPVSGEVIARNDRLQDTPELINQSPYEDGWIIRIRLSDPSELDALLDAGAYGAEVTET